MAKSPVWTLIDTRVWVLGLRAPLVETGTPLAEMSARAAELVRSALEDEVVLLTTQLVAEVHHVAAHRVRPRADAALLTGYLRQVLRRRNVRFRDPGRRGVLDALERSSASGIHVWDYLVALPWRKEVDRIVTMDPHFRHPDFTSIARIENPFDVWKTEGEKL